MPISNYLRSIRNIVGSEMLMMPGLSMACFDEHGRLLMADHGGKKGWAIPGGSVDPEDDAADTAVREMWEEANLRVEPTRVIGIYGGKDFLTTYPNGDQIGYKDVCMECRIVSGDLKPDGDEIAALRFFEPDEIWQMDLHPWMAHILPDVLDRESRQTRFPPVTWQPPEDGVRKGGISDYMRHLRAKVGTAQVMMPAAPTIGRNAQGQILMQRRSDNGLWGLPGGAIDPGETPTDAAIREIWEETGITAKPVRVAGIFAGKEGFVTYPNGDEVSIFSFAFECQAVDGIPTIDEDESLEVRYFDQDDVLALDMAPRWKRRLRLMFDHAGPDAYFDPPTAEPWNKPPQPKSQHFRAGTGAVILNPDLDRVLLFKRAFSNDDWQFPQGGLDIGEEPLAGVLREIQEETGITEGDLEQLPVPPKLLAYEIPAAHRSPKTGRGQTQWWYFFQFVGDSSAITLGDQEEFSDYQWTTMDDAVERIVGFKREVYEGLAGVFTTLQV